MKPEKEFVKMMACPFCGKDTGIALDRTLGRKGFDERGLMPSGKVPDWNGCDDCKLQSAQDLEQNL